MKKLVLLSLAALPLFAAAQVPSYVPANGLVGWWPFNGNANDEGGNGNNGTVNGAALTTDRFGNANKAYNFDGTSNFIDISSLNNISYKPITYNLWMNLNAYNTINYPLGGGMQLIGRDWSGYYDIGCLILWDYPAAGVNNDISYYIGQTAAHASYTPPLNSWLNITMTLSSQDTIKFYINGNLQYTQHYPTNSSVNGPFRIGAGADPNPSIGRYHYNGKLDDIGVWNRALTPQEISALYNGCSNSITSQPGNQSLVVSNNALFTTSSSDPNATYQWQTDLGLGFQNISNAGQYSGATNDTLTVNSVNVGNNNQAFRCIVSSGSCTDTTSAAYITITTGITENTSSTFTVYPNPANNTITVSWSTADVKTLTLRDAAGRVVRTYNVNGTQAQLSLEGLASGVYFLSVGNCITCVQKIVKQ